MPFRYPCLFSYRDKQIWVSHIQFEFLLLFLVEVSHLGCLAGMVTVLPTGLSSNLVFLGYLLGWTLSGGTASETKT